MTAVETVTLTEIGARQLDAVLAVPTQRGPGLLLLCEMWGLTEETRALAQSYAARGFCVLAPNLFWRSEPSRGLIYEVERDLAWARLAAFDFDAAAGDIRGATDWLRRHPACTGKVAALGFCMGGRLAFLAAARAKVDAAVSFYGLGIAKHLNEIDSVTCRLQLHYGLADPYIPKEEIDAVSAAVAGRENVATYLYPGAGHAFFNPARRAFDAAASETAEQHLDRLLDTLRR